MPWCCPLALSARPILAAHFQEVSRCTEGSDYVRVCCELDLLSIFRILYRVICAFGLRSGFHRVAACVCTEGRIIGIPIPHPCSLLPAPCSPVWVAAAGGTVAWKEIDRLVGPSSSLVRPTSDHHTEHISPTSARPLGFWHPAASGVALDLNARCLTDHLLPLRDHVGPLEAPAGAQREDPSGAGPASRKQLLRRLSNTQSRYVSLS